MEALGLGGGTGSGQKAGQAQTAPLLQQEGPEEWLEAGPLRSGGKEENGVPFRVV